MDNVVTINGGGTLFLYCDARSAVFLLSRVFVENVKKKVNECRILSFLFTYIWTSCLKMLFVMIVYVYFSYIV